MSDTVIQVENVSKKYVIGHQDNAGYATLRDQMSKGAKSLAQQLGRPFGKQISASTKEEFWALKEVSFEVKQGDRLGIIGRNGAGKSTLLKILSRITEPTAGQITIQGRVASLLEVGTGFHPELTGRENIFLNGAILGMSKLEIKKKFDEIVDFAEIEKFLDTPVKRYSSGMYVRLAFAVAAHLEPEILIVDEVLAVGDIQFQKKCFGKMEEFSEIGGRTILFVSHNIDAIQRLCSRCIVLDKGQLVDYSQPSLAIRRYLNKASKQSSPCKWIDLSKLERTGTGDAKFMAVQYRSPDSLTDGHNSGHLWPKSAVDFEVVVHSNLDRDISSFAISILSETGVILVNIDSISTGRLIRLHAGTTHIGAKVKSLYLRPGQYSVSLWMDITGSGSDRDCLDYIESAFELEVMSAITDQLGVESLGNVDCDFSIFEIKSSLISRKGEI
ncbi:MAG: teichoic-acid-transporting ATPase [Leptolyngbya foveolarum]|uniref:Teichoic-acid-transporting ATPase n=1 Tax=Leptolyngbya foveolarum TaxID=47253 RepID=A0A2W4U6C3_9CYAN|nr:MAG: teichoic-acid-transporting ATPase [Leptolyngbya foveolarum]